MNNSVLFQRSTIADLQTRSADVPSLSLARPISEQFWRSLYYQGVVDWNNLSLDLKNSPSLESFKIKLKRQIILSYDSLLTHVTATDG